MLLSGVLLSVLVMEPPHTSLRAERAGAAAFTQPAPNLSRVVPVRPYLLADFLPVQRPDNGQALPPAPDPRRTFRPVARPAEITQEANLFAILPSARPSELVTTAPLARASAAPSGPSKTSLTRAATVPNALPLQQLSVIGISGRGNKRTAVVLFPNGGVARFQVGDPMDGGRLVSISPTRVRYIKAGETIVLEVPLD